MGKCDIRPLESDGTDASDAVQHRDLGIASTIGLIVSQSVSRGWPSSGYSGCKKAKPTPARLAASWELEMGYGSWEFGICELRAASWKLELATASEDLLPR